MLADPAVLLRLLDLAALDTTLAQLAHRRKTLPELAVVDRTDSDLARMDDELVELGTARNDLDRDLRRMDNDVEAVRQRKDRDSARMTSGAVANPKDLERLEHEIATLVRRQNDLEDQQLELMERSEDLDTKLAKATATRATIDSDRTAAIAVRDEQWRTIDSDSAARTTDRQTVAGELPVDVATLYDKLRAGGGSGAAAITARRCGGCRMDLAGSELAAVRAAAPDVVLRCESCRCIQVRTATSGL